MSTYTSSSLYEALRAVIVNLPQRAIALELRLSARELPEMDLKLEVLSEAGDPVVADGRIQTELRRFRIVPIEPTEEPTT